MSATEQDISPREFRSALHEFQKELGSRASVLVSVNDHAFDGYDQSRTNHYQTNFRGAVYLDGMSNGLTFMEGRDTLRDLLATLQEKWVTYKHQHELVTIRKMALAIIRITSELGECTDAALRSEFSTELVQRFGAQACAHADDMAGRGPFTIITMGGANAPAETVEAA